MEEKIKLNSAQFLVWDFGGVRALARSLNVNPGIVSRWVKKGTIPSKYYSFLIEVSEKDPKKFTNEYTLIHGADLLRLDILERTPFLLD